MQFCTQDRLHMYACVYGMYACNKFASLRQGSVLFKHLFCLIDKHDFSLSTNFSGPIEMHGF